MFTNLRSAVCECGFETHQNFTKHIYYVFFDDKYVFIKIEK